jgi:DNA-binding transcriptional regulator PaaX
VADAGAYRLVDRTIQKWRRKGWISFVRMGRDTLWSMTDAGREASAAADKNV